MSDRRHRQTHICPQCGRKFKNYRWARCWKYDGVHAECPFCHTPAHDFAKLRKVKEDNEEQTQTKDS